MNPATRPNFRNCRNWLTSSRARRQVMTERLTEQWLEIRLHATIEQDPVTLSRLAAELDRRKRQEILPST
jgi:hypothetical protein